MEILKVLSSEYITRDVLQIFTQKPPGLEFTPGQAAEISIKKEGWEDEKRPFTFTSLPEDPFLQFTIKTYPEHNGVTNELRHLRKDEELLMHDVFGAISYRGEGVFIAGGAGVTPFISIFRYLKLKGITGNNKLIFANKTRDDIILKYEFEHLLGHNFINILSDQELNEYYHGYLNEEILRKYIDYSVKYIYLCGPPPMMEATEIILSGLNFGGELIKEAL